MVGIVVMKRVKEIQFIFCFGNLDVRKKSQVPSSSAITTWFITYVLMLYLEILTNNVSFIVRVSAVLVSNIGIL
jgi:hypothetical protein